jgi:para-nitrobenzyl esterase
VVRLPEAEAKGSAAFSSFGNLSLRQLRAIPATEIMQKTAGGFGPVIDGWFMPSPPDSFYRAGMQNATALLTGWNQDEGFVEKPLDAVSYARDIRNRYTQAADSLLSFYPGTSDEEAAQSQIGFSRDIVFGIQNFALANAQSADSSARVYVYRFRRKLPATGKYVKYGAFHSGEVPYVFDNLNRVDRPWSQTDRQLAGEMSSYWVNFVRTGDPNAAGLPSWPLYKKQSKMIEEFDLQTAARPMPDAPALDFLFYALTGEQP